MHTTARPTTRPTAVRRRAQPAAIPARPVTARSLAESVDLEAVAAAVGVIGAPTVAPDEYPAAPELWPFTVGETVRGAAWTVAALIVLILYMLAA